MGSPARAAPGDQKSSFGRHFPTLPRGCSLGPGSFNSVKFVQNHLKGSVTASTSVSQSSKALLHEGIGELPSLVSPKGIDLWGTWALASRTRPHGKSPERLQQPLCLGPEITRGVSRGPGALSLLESALGVP